MPNHENIKRWVDALRSGKYKQGKGFLNKDGEYCCLGVACDLAEKGGVNVQRTVRVEDGAVMYDGLHGYIPPVVADWLGIGESAGLNDDDNDVVIGKSPDGDWDLHATTANDDRAWDFGQIADALEQTYLTPVPA